MKPRRLLLLVPVALAVGLYLHSARNPDPPARKPSARETPKPPKRISQASQPATQMMPSLVLRVTTFRSEYPFPADIEDEAKDLAKEQHRLIKSQIAKPTREQLAARRLEEDAFRERHEALLARIDPHVRAAMRKSKLDILDVIREIGREMSLD